MIPEGGWGSRLDKIGTGELDARVAPTSRTALDLQANSINDMAAALKTAQRRSDPRAVV